MVFSNAKHAGKECARSEFTASRLYVRRAVSDIIVWPRENFINPTRKLAMGEAPKLSENAELKQHITGVGLYTKAPVGMPGRVLETSRKKAMVTTMGLRAADHMDKYYAARSCRHCGRG